MIDAAVISLLVALVCVPVWPGIFTVDSQAIFKRAITGRISNWYPPTLTWIWGVADQFGMPLVGMLVAASTGVVTALLATYRLVLGPAGSRVATAGTLLWPPVYGMLGWIGRDVWFLGFVLAVLALVGWAAQLPRYRWTLVTLAGIAAWFALDARQAFPVLAVWGGIAAWMAGTCWRWRPVVIPAAAILAAAAGIGLQLAASALVVSVRHYPEQWLQYQDLLAVSIAVDQSQLPPSLFPSQNLDAVRRLGVEEAIAGSDPLVVWNPSERGAAVQAQVTDAWAKMVRNRPLDYLRARGRFYADQLAIGRPANSAYFGSSDELDWERSDELRQSFPALNQRRLEVLDTFDGHPPGTGGPVHAVWVYLLLGLGGAGLLTVVPGPARVLGASALVLQVTLQGGLFFFAPVVEYRFQLFQIVLGIVLAIVAAAVLRPTLLANSAFRTAGTGPAQGSIICR